MSSDDRTGVEIARALDAIVEKKASLGVGALIALGILAGVYIGFGAVAATTVKSLGGPSPALTSVLAASVFCVGLILVIRLRLFCIAPNLSQQRPIGLWNPRFPETRQMITEPAYLVRQSF